MNYIVLKADLKRDEGERLKPYRDTVGKLTIGVGRNLDDVGISESEADFLLMSDIGRTEGDLDHHLPWWRQQDEARQRVLLNMGFNMGVGALLNFRNMLSALTAGNYAKAADEMMNSKWARQVGERAERLAKLMREG